MTIDHHIHAIPQGMLDWLREHSEQADARFERRDPSKAPFLIVGGRWPFELKPVFHDRDQFLQELEAAGIQQALLSPVPQLFFYDADPGLTRRQHARITKLFSPGEPRPRIESRSSRLSRSMTQTPRQPSSSGP